MNSVCPDPESFFKRGYENSKSRPRPMRDLRRTASFARLPPTARCARPNHHGKRKNKNIFPKKKIWLEKISDIEKFLKEKKIWKEKTMDCIALWTQVLQFLARKSLRFKICLGEKVKLCCRQARAKFFDANFENCFNKNCFYGSSGDPHQTSSLRLLCTKIGDFFSLRFEDRMVSFTPQ